MSEGEARERLAEILRDFERTPQRRGPRGDVDRRALRRGRLADGTNEFVIVSSASPVQMLRSRVVGEGSWCWDAEKAPHKGVSAAGHLGSGRERSEFRPFSPGSRERGGSGVPAASPPGPGAYRAGGGR